MPLGRLARRLWGSSTPPRAMTEATAPRTGGTIRSTNEVERTRADLEAYRVQTEVAYREACERHEARSSGEEGDDRRSAFVTTPYSEVAATRPTSESMREQELEEIVEEAIVYGTTDQRLVPQEPLMDWGVGLDISAGSSSRRGSYGSLMTSPCHGEPSEISEANKILTNNREEAFNALY